MAPRETLGFAWETLLFGRQIQDRAGGGRSSLFTGSKNRACNGESRADHGKRIWRVHTNMMVYAVVIYAFICFYNICMIFYS